MAAMTETEAFDVVVRLGDAFAEPAPLCEGDVLDILDECRLADSEGRAPSHPDWQASYWLERAVQRIFEVRALRASSSVDIVADGTTIRASQYAEALNKMAALWRSRCVGSAGGIR
jgi:hypothetical protein